jgi:hypothetical protein
MKITKTYSVEREVYSLFEDIANDLDLNKSSLIEEKIKEVILDNIKIDTKTTWYLKPDIEDCELIKEESKLNKISSIIEETKNNKIPIDINQIKSILDNEISTDYVKIKSKTFENNELKYILDNDVKINLFDFNEMYEPCVDPDFLNIDNLYQNFKDAVDDMDLENINFISKPTSYKLIDEPFLENLIAKEEKKEEKELENIAKGKIREVLENVDKIVGNSRFYGEQLYSLIKITKITTLEDENRRPKHKINDRNIIISNNDEENPFVIITILKEKSMLDNNPILRIMRDQVEDLENYEGDLFIYEDKEEPELFKLKEWKETSKDELR